jgi:hypothetical protein
VISGRTSTTWLSSEEGVINESARFGMSAIGYRGPAALLIRTGITITGEGV